ncbi:tyrosine--tRNA ligase [Candidatus Azambacteria bacterium]|nr:tyrosine--tRNA ligase [Candidatus Azambacteria bacterium]
MKIVADAEKIKTLLNRAVSGAVVKEHLEKALSSGKSLRIKFGIDPTSPDIHLGHSVPLLKLKQFQEMGHKAVLIIGDFTARIGDPTGRTEARKPLAESEIKKNFKNYLSQAGKIINIKKTEIHFNGEWFKKMKAADFYRLAGHMTVQQVLKREDFRKRIESGKDISATEMMYPLFQGYDSVMVKADVEIGGEDQLLNLLAGRKIQRAYGQPEQDILTTWLIEGTDGAKKMSKSYGNYIGIAEKPDIMFGKIMSTPDSLIIKYFKALTLVPDNEIVELEFNMKSGSANPRDVKSRLAFELVKMYHGEKNAEKAEMEFEKVFRKHELPEKMPAVLLEKGSYKMIDLLIKTNLVKSKSEARRLVNEGAVKIGGRPIKDLKINIASDFIVQIGKRRFAKIKIK